MEKAFSIKLSPFETAYSNSLSVEKFEIEIDKPQFSLANVDAIKSYREFWLTRAKDPLVGGGIILLRPFGSVT